MPERIPIQTLNKMQMKAAKRMWSYGRDTLEIAQFLGVDEATVVRSMTLSRDRTQADPVLFETRDGKRYRRQAEA